MSVFKLHNKQNLVFDKNTWLFVILTGVLFFQFILGHFQVFHSILISSLWKDTATFFNFYIPRLLIACAIAVWVYYTRHKWWVIVVPVLVDVALWCIIPAHTINMLDVSRELLLGGIVWAYIKFRNSDCKSIICDKRDGIVMLIFALTIFVQCLIFHFSIFSDYEPPTIMDHIMLYVSKVGVSMFIAAWALIMRHRWGMIVASVCINIWIFADMIYFRANGFFLDALSFTMIDNMNGWWDTVPMYIYWSDWLVLIPTIILVGVTIKEAKNSQIDVFGFIVAITVGTLLTFISVLGFQATKIGKIPNIQLNPFAENANLTIVMPGETDYIRKFSVVHAFIYDVIDFNRIILSNDEDLLSEGDLENINRYLINANYAIAPSYKTPVIICLVESMENWAISPEVTPNICKFMDEHNEHILYAENISSQVKNAHSSDGQMIVNTGLLPVEKGTVCFRYYPNVFPSVSEIYGEKSCALFPHDLNVWNQIHMSNVYKFKDNFVTSTSDVEIFSKVVSLSPEYDYILAVTSSTHTPFTYWADSSLLQLPKDMPIHMANYMKCMWCLDWGIDKLLSQVSQDEKLSNSTIVITGDHTIFNNDNRKEFSKYCDEHEISYRVDQNYSPLIIYSPTIKQYTHIIEPAYQMDIYPTILHAIGCEDYYWKGFGVNLANTPPGERIVASLDAMVLSDKMIRQNYFKTIKQ